MKNYSRAGIILALLLLNLFVSAQVSGILFDNGPLVNSPGTGQGGADESVVYDPLTLLAYPSSSPIRSADNFTVASAGWTVDSISFYDLIPNAPTSPSYFTGYFLRIWDGMPGMNGSHVIWGDRTTNRLISSAWSNIYRRGDDNPGSTSLAIFRNTCTTPGLNLAPGEYWVEAQPLAQQGLYTFTPPITLMTPASGDAVQFNELTNTWEVIQNNSYPQGMPFTVYGENLTVSLDAGISSLVSPQSAQGLGLNEQVSVTVKNFGTQILNNVPVFFQLEGSEAVFATIPGPISPEAEVIFTFPQAIDLSQPGTYNITCGTQLSGDLFTGNDAREFKIWNFSTQVNMQSNSVAACSGMFYDGGGPDADYASNETLTMYFFPASDAPNARLEFNFEEFDLENPYDKLMVYDGPTWEYHPLIGEFTGGMVDAIGTIRSSDPSGSLTFRFISDQSVSRPGWKASFHCFIPKDNDLAVTGLTAPLSVTQNAPSSFTVKVRNEGNNSQENYSVKLFLEDGTELASTEGLSLNFNEEHEFSLLASVPVSGLQKVFAKVILGGDQEESNDASSFKEVQVDPAGTGFVFIGKDNEMNQRLPVSYSSMNSLSETIYYPEEIGMEGMISGIGYVYSFREDVDYAPLKIWMGETTLNDLSEAWIPSSQLTQVYDGTASYIKGVDTIRIDFSTPYEYHGGNLVVLVYRPLDYTQYPGNELGPNLFQVSYTEDHPDRSRQFFADVIVIDPANPRFGTTYPMHPNTLLKFDVSMMASLIGKVSDAYGLPLQDASVTVTGTHEKATSCSNGDYAVNTIWPGSSTAKAEKYGYDDDSVELNFAGGTVIHDFTLGIRPMAFITGSIRPSDAPWNGLSGATITITGYDTAYSTTSTGTGFFLLANVFGNTTYEIDVTHPGYENYHSSFYAGAGTTDLGSIVLNEPTAPPQNIVAVDNGSSAHVSWDEMTLDYTIQYDNDSVYYYLTSFSDLRESAIRFTPEGYPCNLQAAMLNVHDLAAASGNPAGSFKVKVYDDDGTDNLPGTMLAEVLVTPGMDGWVTVDLSSFGINITSGDFYLAHAQVGSWPNYVEIGIDQSTHPENRSYSKPASWSPWALDPYYCHFMIRALVSGTSGKSSALLNGTGSVPTSLENSYPEGMTGYTVYRLHAGEEDEPNLWNSLSYNQSAIAYDDNDWDELPWGEYRYAVRTNYAFGVESNAGFSNILQKDLFITATVSISTNTDYIPSDASVTLTCNDGDPEHRYVATSNSSGNIVFNPFYRGTYRVQVSHHNFMPFDEVIDITDPDPVQVFLTEKVMKPVFVQAEDQDTLADLTWYDPTFLRDFVNDDNQADASFGGLESFPVWFGNFIENDYSGNIISVDLFFEQHPFASDEPVTIEIFNQEHNLVGTSEPFIPEYNHWFTVRVQDVPVAGNFYVMVHFSQQTGESHYLGYDMSEQTSGSAGAYAFDGNSWFTMPEFIQGLANGVFMIRPTLNVGFQGMEPGRSISYFMVYRLEPGQENNQDEWVFLENTVIDPTYQDFTWPGLEPGYYLYAVNSLYSTGNATEFAFSNILNHTSVLLAPQNLAVEQTAPDEAIFTWEPVNGYGLVGYEVFLDNMQNPVATVTDTFFVFTGLQADIEYIAGVRAIYGTGQSTTSTMPFTLVIAGQPEFSLENIRLYPNPAKNVVTIENAIGTIVEIYGLTGVCVRSVKIEDAVTPINVDDLIQGSYIVRISHENSVLCKKLVIMK